MARGLLTRRQLAGRAWRRLLPDVYLDARRHVDHGVLITAARLIIPSTAVIAGCSAAWLYGARSLVDEEDPVEVLVPTAARFGPVHGLRIRCTSAWPDNGVRGGVTIRTRTAGDIARWAPSLMAAVVRLDQVLAAGVVTDDDLPVVLDWIGPQRARARARRAVTMADGRAASPPESMVRVALHLAGLAPVPQFEVFHEGNFLARVDLAFPAARVAVEYDGAYHAGTGQFRRDRKRLNRLTAAGWRVIFVTAEDLGNLGRVTAAVQAALRHP